MFKNWRRQRDDSRSRQTHKRHSGSFAGSRRSAGVSGLIDKRFGQTADAGT